MHERDELHPGMHYGADSRSIEVRVGSLHCRLTRIDDHRYFSLVSNAAAIKEDLFFLDGLHFRLHRAGDLPNLAELYAVFKELFGETGFCHDEYKGAFSFPFEVEVFKEEEVYPYVLNVLNRRGSVDFRFFKVLSGDNRGFRRDTYYQPFSEELTGDEINLLISYLHQFVVGGIRILRKFYNEGFVKRNQSELIIFGFGEGGFFQRHYEDEDEFHVAWERMSRRIRARRWQGQVPSDVG